MKTTLRRWIVLTAIACSLISGSIAAAAADSNPVTPELIGKGGGGGE